MKRSLICSVFIIIGLFGCQNDRPVKFMKVHDGTIFDNDPDSVKNISSVFGTYYAFNYKDADLEQLLKMLDTITFDTSYSDHSYRFMKYNSSLPDTIELKQAQLTGDYSKLEDPGSAKFYKYLILDFTYTRHYFSQGRHFPDSYSIDFNDKGKETAVTKYYVKDSITKKLQEVRMDEVYPIDMTVPD